jgi:hypothetical protein
MPKVIKKEDPKDPGIMGKIRTYITLKNQVDDLSAERDSLKKDLIELVDTEGEPDEKGHLWYRLSEEVEGINSLQRQRKVSQRLDSSVAEPMLKEKGLYDRCYQMVPVLDESEVMACLYEGLITEEEIDAMFPKSVSYVFLAKG